MGSLFHGAMQSLLRSRVGRWLGIRTLNSLRWNMEQVDAELARRISPDRIVRSGPFTGLEYPDANVAGSALLPKLAGSYEAALHETVRRLAAKPYRTVINIGCGEGYYAVGLARLLPDAAILAYDADPRALELCQALAEQNGVAGRMQLQGACTPALLQALTCASPVLIICDCEAYEYVLLRPENLPFERWDALVELHDATPGRPRDAELAARFASSHQALVVADQPRRPADFPALAMLSAAERAIVFEEYRPIVMHWLVLEQQT